MENVGIFYVPVVYLLPLEIFYGHVVYFVVIWHIFPRFGMLYQEKSGKPECGSFCFSLQNKGTRVANTFMDPERQIPVNCLDTPN
jgi:hypothetical protein